MLSSCGDETGPRTDESQEQAIEEAAPFIDYSPAWSPDGATIAFSSNRNGDADIFVMNTDGSDIRQITFDESNEDTQAWSPDGSKLAFCSDRDGGKDVFVMDADGSEWVKLTEHPSDDCNPAWSPDGNKIAFMTNRHGDWRENESDNWELYIMDTDGGNKTRLTDTPGYDLITGQAFSPDGQEIVFCSTLDEKFMSGPNRFDGFDLYIMNADGSNIRQLTFDEGQDSYPYWSPDGQKISYTHVEKEAPYVNRGQNYEMYVINPDGAGVTQLTNNPYFDFEGWWSPDSKNMVYTSNASPPQFIGADPINAIHIMDADGSNVMQLTNKR